MFVYICIGLSLSRTWDAGLEGDQACEWGELPRPNKAGAVDTCYPYGTIDLHRSTSFLLISTDGKKREYCNNDITDQLDEKKDWEVD